MEKQQPETEVCTHNTSVSVIEYPIFSIDGVMLGVDVRVYCDGCREQV